VEGGDKDILDDLPHLVKILIEVVDCFRTLEAHSGRGRPYLYSNRCLIKAFLIMAFYQLNSLRSLARFLEKNKELRIACGFELRVPSYRTFTRRFKLLEHPVVQLAQLVIQVLIEQRIINLKVISSDSSLIEADGKKLHKGKPGTRATDPDAAWGWSQTRGWIFGYKLHLTSTVLAKGQTLVPLTWQVSSANRNDTIFLLPLMHQAARLAEVCQEEIRYSLADKGYDSDQNYHGCQDLGVRLITPVRKMKTRTGKSIKPSAIKQRVIRFLQTQAGKKMYYRRGDTERLIGHIKDLFLVDPLPVVRSVNVRPYLAIINLAYLLAVLYNHLNGRSLRAIKSLVA